MTHLFCRVRRSYGELKDLFPRLVGKCSQLAVYEHPEPGNVHIHFLIMDIIVSSDTLKNYIRHQVGLVNKTDWSFKSTYGKDPITQDSKLGAITYMSKGKYDSSYQIGFTQEVLNERKAMWVIKPITPSTAVEAKQNKQRKIDMLKIMIEKLDSKIKDNTLNEYDVYKVIRGVLIENDQVLGMYKVLEFRDAINLRIDRKGFYEEYSGLIQKRKPMV